MTTRNSARAFQDEALVRHRPLPFEPRQSRPEARAKHMNNVIGDCTQYLSKFLEKYKKIRTRKTSHTRGHDQRLKNLLAVYECPEGLSQSLFPYSFNLTGHPTLSPKHLAAMAKPPEACSDCVDAFGKLWHSMGILSLARPVCWPRTYSLTMTTVRLHYRASEKH